MTGRIYKGIGGFYYVKTERGIVECRARGRFRKDGIVPFVGDYVEIENGYVVDIMPRSSCFARPPVANISMLLTVASLKNPVVPTLLIDRMTALAIYKGIKPVVLLNKSDLLRADELLSAYQKAEITALILSAETGEGCDELVNIIRSETAAFCGNSGVGKSSILNRIHPVANAETGELAAQTGRGRHTTRHVELFDLDCGAVLVDTPGFSSFEDEILHADLWRCFPEFEKYAGDCRFQDCVHINDAGCAVREAVKRGEIAQSRYDSFRAMHEKAKAVNPWK